MTEPPGGDPAARPAPVPNRELLLPYLLPYLVYLGLAVALPERVVPREWSYALRGLATAAALAWAWRWYVPLLGPGSLPASLAVGGLAGLVGAVLWVALKAPFVAAGIGAGEAWTDAAWAARLASSGLVVPVFEELVMRGYALRIVLQWQEGRAAGVRDPFGAALDRSSIDTVEPGAWSPLAVALSTGLFMAGHDFATEWPAAALYGLLMAGLWVVRRDLLTCVVAHGVTNVALAVWVRETGSWALW